MGQYSAGQVHWCMYIKKLHNFVYYKYIYNIHAPFFKYMQKATFKKEHLVDRVHLLHTCKVVRRSFSILISRIFGERIESNFT